MDGMKEERIYEKKEKTKMEERKNEIGRWMDGWMEEREEGRED